MSFKPRADVTVIVGIYAESQEELLKWATLAERATRSAARQTLWPYDIILVAGETLAKARNAGAEMATTEWLIFLDADDELHPEYVEKMFEAEGDIRRPMTQGVYPDGTEDETAVFIPRGDLYHTNFIVIGAMLKREQFLRLGGFEEYPIMEDWALFLKMHQDGAQIGDADGAIYRVHVNPNSRNAGSRNAQKVYGDIKRRFRRR